MGTTDTKALRDAAEWLGDDGADNPGLAVFRAWGKDVDAAADEIEALRNGAAGASVEERLERCRDRAAIILGPAMASGHVDANITGTHEETDAIVARSVERMAHAMLAAERPPSASTAEHLLDAAAHQSRIDGQQSGARTVLSALEEMTRTREPGGGMTMNEIRSWAAAVRREMGLGEG